MRLLAGVAFLLLLAGCGRDDEALALEEASRRVAELETELKREREANQRRARIEAMQAEAKAVRERTEARLGKLEELRSDGTPESDPGSDAAPPAQDPEHAWLLAQMVGDLARMGRGDEDPPGGSIEPVEEPDPAIAEAEARARAEAEAKARARAEAEAKARAKAEQERRTRAEAAAAAKARAAEREELAGTRVGDVALAGQTFHDAIVVEVTASSAKIRHRDGVSRIDLRRLPADWQEVFLFDPGDAETDRTARENKIAEEEQDREQARREAEDRRILGNMQREVSLKVAAIRRTQSEIARHKVNLQSITAQRKQHASGSGPNARRLAGLAADTKAAIEKLEDKIEVLEEEHERLVERLEERLGEEGER